jgi:hypothetical protein
MKKLIFIIFFLSVPAVVFSVPAPDPNTAILEHVDTTVSGMQITLNRIDNTLTNLNESIIAIQNQLSASQSFDWNKGMSFVAGLLTSMAVVVSANRRF